jgi:hypothetical protein
MDGSPAPVRQMRSAKPADQRGSKTRPEGGIE